MAFITIFYIVNGIFSKISQKEPERPQPKSLSGSRFVKRRQLENETASSVYGTCLGSGASAYSYRILPIGSLTCQLMEYCTLSTIFTFHLRDKKSYLIYMYIYITLALNNCFEFEHVCVMCYTAVFICIFK